MMLTIVITVVITALSALVLYLIDRCNQIDLENGKQAKSIDKMSQDVLAYEMREQERTEKDAYNKGLYDGRETDALYRSMLAKIKNGDQVSVMMGGER